MTSQAASSTLCESLESPPLHFAIPGGPSLSNNPSAILLGRNGELSRILTLSGSFWREGFYREKDGVSSKWVTTVCFWFSISATLLGSVALESIHCGEPLPTSLDFSEPGLTSVFYCNNAEPLAFFRHAKLLSIFLKHPLPAALTR